MNAHATCRISRTTQNGRPCLTGIVDIDSDKGWLGFATVFGFTAQAVQDAAYFEADRRAEAHGLRLDYMQTV